MVKWRNVALQRSSIRRGRLMPKAARGFQTARRRDDGRAPSEELMARRRPRPTVREENERALLEAAEWVFAEQGFAGATTAAIAQRAGLPKANLHYYFPTKETLYRSVIERVLTAWLAAASSFDASEDPTVALSAYIGAKMDLAREMPLATRIWSAEIMRGAPMIQDFLDTTLTQWVVSREQVVRRWIAAGKLKPIEPKFLFYMIWATTQQYANAAHEMATLNMGRPLDDRAFERAKREVIEIILRGVAAA
jgi:TetR/AcrR family transcriptional regulator